MSDTDISSYTTSSSSSLTVTVDTSSAVNICTPYMSATITIMNVVNLSPTSQPISEPTPFPTQTQAPSPTPSFYPTLKPSVSVVPTIFPSQVPTQQPSPNYLTLSQDISCSTQGCAASATFSGYYDFSVSTLSITNLFGDFASSSEYADVFVNGVDTFVDCSTGNDCGAPDVHERH